MYRLIIVLGFVMIAPLVWAETIWVENFSDVRGWGIVYNSAGGSTITASGGLGAMYVNAGGAEAAFAPTQVEANFIPFDPTKKSEYTIKWKVDSLTDSVGWDIAIDQFDSKKKFVDTMWNIHPVEGNTAEKGEFSKNLGQKSWSAYTKFIIPKVGVHTGFGAQTVRFDYIKVDRGPKNPLKKQ